MRIERPLLVLLTVVLSLTTPLDAQRGRGRGRGSDPVGQIQQIAPGLYWIPGGGANMVIRVTDEGAIVVDTKNPSDETYQRVRQQIATVTRAPVRYIVNTHHHGDHTGNNARFIEAGAEAVAHENVRAHMLEAGTEGAPSLTYATSQVLRVGDAEVQLHHFGRAHTDGDTIVYFPDLKVVMLTDTVTDGAPIVDARSGGNALEWRTVLEQAAMLDFDTAIPGRGDPRSKADVLAFQSRFDTLIERATDAVRRGVSKEQFPTEVRTDDLGWQLAGFFFDPLYDELSQNLR